MEAGSKEIKGLECIAGNLTPPLVALPPQGRFECSLDSAA